MTASAFDDESIFEIEDLTEMPLQRFNEVMAEKTYALIRGVIPEEKVRQGLDRLREVFDHTRDHPARGHSSDAVATNFQKLNVGGEALKGPNDDARFFRVLYNPISQPDVYGMRGLFSQLARVRNRIAELPSDFALGRVEPNGLWTASRIHQYPRGGGFFRRHTDYIVKDVAEEKSARFFQLVLTLSRKGEHFHEGGAFVDRGDERIYLDDGAQLGDIVVYDGRTVHGVEDIDPAKPMDLTSINGRLSGFATLYKQL